MVATTGGLTTIHLLIVVASLLIPIILQNWPSGNTPSTATPTPAVATAPLVPGTAVPGTFATQHPVLAALGPAAVQALEQLLANQSNTQGIAQLATLLGHAGSIVPTAPVAPVSVPVHPATHAAIVPTPVPAPVPIQPPAS